MANNQAKTKAFTKTKFSSKRPIVAYDVCCTIWRNKGRGEIFIGAPSIDELADAWKQITDEGELDRSVVQRVLVCQSPMSVIQSSLNTGQSHD